VSAEIFVSGNSFQLIDGSDPAFPDPAALEASNGLLCAFERGGMVLTGIDMGPVRVDAEALDAESSIDSRWEEVVDVTLDVPSGRLGVSSNLDAEPTGLPLLTAHGPGPYRVRVSARGRASEVGGIVESSNEEYLIQAWPGPAAPANVHRILFHRLRV
jgi:hypothetical protein